MAKKSKKPVAKPALNKAKPAPAAKGPNYELGVLYGQLGNAIKAALERKK